MSDSARLRSLEYGRVYSRRYRESHRVELREYARRYRESRRGVVGLKRLSVGK